MAKVEHYRGLNTDLEIIAFYPLDSVYILISSFYEYLTEPAS
jgi:hypothetical protein